MFRHTFLALLALLSLTLSSCDDYDTWTQHPGAGLRFVPDTLRIDTLFCTVSSATSTVLAYNPASAGLRITDVALAKGSESVFRVNVDGRYLIEGRGEDFEVRGGDSIFVRVECTMPRTLTEEPAIWEDDLVFTLESGRQDKLHLMAVSLNATFHDDTLIVERDTLIQTDKPTIFRRGIVVRQGATLTIGEGSVLYFSPQQGLHVSGTLRIMGTLDNPVELRGDRMDRMFDYLYYDQTPNQWAGVILDSLSSNHTLRYMDLHSSDYGILAKETDLKMENCIVHNTGGYGLWAQECIVDIVNSRISNNLADCIFQLGGELSLTHCTVAQFFPYSSDRGMALMLCNNIAGKQRFDTTIRVVNSIITGYGPDVVSASLLPDDWDLKTRIQFRRCLLNTVWDAEDTRFEECLKDSLTTGNFRLMDSHLQQYDFTPDSLSRSRGLADPAISARYPLDIMGRERSDAPDAGAYQSQYLTEGKEEEK